MSAGAETTRGHVSNRSPPVPPWPALARPLVLLRLPLGYKSSRCAPCNLSRGYRWAVGELSGDDGWAPGALSEGDRCTSRGEPPAHGLYKGGVGGGVPPARVIHFRCNARNRSLLSLLSLELSSRVPSFRLRLPPRLPPRWLSFPPSPILADPPSSDPIATFLVLGQAAGVHVLRSA